MLDIKKLRELCEKATPGPWLEEPRQNEATDFAYVWAVHRCVLEDDGCLVEEDADFIAAARTALPEALDEIERLQNENNQLHKDLDHYKKVSEIASRGLAEAVRRGE